MIKALHITYRFGREIIGGAEHYQYKLAQHLAELGVDVTVVTTKTANVPHLTRFGVRWDNSLPDFEEYDGLKIHRFPTVNLPKPVVGLLAKFIQRQWEKEEQLIDVSGLIDRKEGGVLGVGWHYPERYGNTVARWTHKRFQVHIFDNNIQRIHIDAFSRNRNKLTLNVGGFRKITIPLSPGWRRYSLEMGGVTVGKIEGILSSTWRPMRDIRSLGIQVRGLSYVSNGVEKSVPLDRDFKDYIGGEKIREWLNILVQRANNRSSLYDHLFDLTRGPICSKMMRFINKNIGHYDIIFGANMPFATFNYAANVARKRGKPCVLLPLAHIEDDFYHWRKYYRSMSFADRILALTPYSKKMLFDRIGVNADVVGAGIEPSEFEKFSGGKEGFRERYDIPECPIILFVGRKSPPKKYDVLINAVEILNNEKGCECVLVMIGPDEDGQTIESSHVRYLGPVSREDLLEAYDRCSVFAIMSESESFGMVALEAWMFKKPVIVNKKCGALASLVEEGVDGYHCADENDVADRVYTLLKDEDFSCRMGSNGYKKIVTNYTWSTVAERVKSIYEEVLKMKDKE